MYWTASGAVAKGGVMKIQEESYPDIRKLYPCFGHINEHYTRVCGLVCPHARRCTWVTMLYVFPLREET